MAKSDELVKYITQRVVQYMETPKEQRKQVRLEKRAREPWTVRWFGMLPMALSMWADTKKAKGKTPESRE
ncbi:YqzE family protein [Paenibacillus aurantius]|uniref:YqzE family protein n=1 Tax=Paenibacillus aurantius TaxID=2918900 RepID=A0AA96LCP7_9BACL|nr:YqzE family protein [Paenibacillus aurantius]WJH34486.1 YqzE family protein [Paenibacillus sp. CC-CFT747]WNQ09691.1 YqzE family protein [Paenibacillus aurantius]